ncbi:MAG TPA: hypothetical protein PL187_21245 [Caldilinea sp.]|nr:hypothetical protein [Anaerolineales bacterium]HRA68565.1 hypothetical protein [Caldilinea sp.]
MSEQTIEAVQVLPEPTPEIVAEFDWLMSLALDEQLGAGEQTRFDALRAGYAELEQVWQAWQWIDSEFEATPALTPTSGFVQRFELHLAEQERQSQQRVLLLSAALALVAVGMVALATTGLGAFVFLTQGQWVGEQVRALALAYTSANLWFGSSVEALVAVVNTPQAQIVGGVYALMLVILVAAWVQLLRHNARMNDAVPIRAS